MSTLRNPAPYTSFPTAQCTHRLISMMSMAPLPSTSYILKAHLSFSCGEPCEVTNQSERLGHVTTCPPITAHLRGDVQRQQELREVDGAAVVGVEGAEGVSTAARVNEN